MEFTFSTCAMAFAPAFWISFTAEGYVGCAKESQQPSRGQKSRKYVRTRGIFQDPAKRVDTLQNQTSGVGAWRGQTSGGTCSFLKFRHFRFTQPQKERQIKHTRGGGAKNMHTARWEPALHKTAKKNLEILQKISLEKNLAKIFMYAISLTCTKKTCQRKHKDRKKPGTNLKTWSQLPHWHIGIRSTH